ncbi:MAG: hypothetical protein R3260_06240 [Pseudomonas sp.]|nr:hypothetical protein [Pseudomonas sp.]
MTHAAKIEHVQARLMGMMPSELVKPFGLQIGHTRLKDLEENFVVTCEQGRGFTSGPVVQVIPRYQEDLQVECVVLAFDEHNKLDAAWFTIESSQYETAIDTLRNAFDLVNTNDPIKGSRSALFAYKDGQIAVHAPLFSKEMTVGYRTERFNKARMDAAAEAFE